MKKQATFAVSANSGAVQLGSTPSPLRQAAATTQLTPSNINAANVYLKKKQKKKKKKKQKKKKTL